MPCFPPANASTTTAVVSDHSRVPSDSGKSVGILKTETSSRSMRRSLSMRSIAGGVGDRREKSGFGLARIEPRVLHYDRYVGFNYAGEVCVLGNRFGIVQVVEANVFRSSGRNCQSVRAYRIPVGIKYRDLDASVSVARVQDANRFVTGQLRRRSVAVRRNVSLSDR